MSFVSLERSSMRTILRRLGTAFVLAAVLVGAAAAPAAAASDAKAVCPETFSNSRDHYYSCGYALFVSEVGDGSEYLTLYDTNDDGYGVAVENWRHDLSDPGPYLGIVTTGYGTGYTWTLHIPEGQKIDFRVCPYTHAHGLYDLLCGPMVTGVA
jgi:opacity protein-like surface antigen